MVQREGCFSFVVLDHMSGHRRRCADEQRPSIPARSPVPAGAVWVLVEHHLYVSLPSLFLLLEARFGRSTLQSYDGILRNRPLRRRLSLVWRCVFIIFLAIPLALGALCNMFLVGESTMLAEAKGLRNNQSYYGMFGPPMCPVHDILLHIRPTLQKSVWLYCVFGLQPMLTLIMLVLAMALYSTPLDKGFGLVSILAGINRQSLDVLRGASLPGGLSQSLKLSITPFQQYGGEGPVEYHVGSATLPDKLGGSLSGNVLYN